jgi:hypothetical protein
MPHKILPYITYYCDVCLDVEVKLLTKIKNEFYYSCPCCSKQIILPYKLPMSFRKNESFLDNRIIILNGTENNDLFSISIRNCDRFTRNYLFHLVKLGLHTARVEYSTNKDSIIRDELSASINTLEDILLEFLTIPDIKYHSDLVRSMYINAENKLP